MNEFIEQFVLESRELVEHATADLLALEKDPGDTAVLDSVFRAFHTLKGSAGIVDFTAMADAVHAAEDALSAVRSGSRRITRELISDCLTCLDQVTQWLHDMQPTGELPSHARAQADAIVARFASSADGGIRPVETAPASRAASWAEALAAKHASQSPTARTAIRYAPDSNCFFEHEDPLARIARLPGLVALDIEPVAPWAPIEALDPFLCNVVVVALTRAAPAEVMDAMSAVVDRCEVVALVEPTPAGADSALSARAREVLESQVALLRVAAAQGMAARAASAGTVAVNVLRSARLTADADRVASSAEAARTSSEPSVLRDAIEAVLRGGEPTVAARAADASVDHAATRTMRVDASRIDALVNVTGELTVAKNSIGHVVKLAEAGDPTVATLLKQRHAALDALVGELQRLVLDMRMLPLRHVFKRFPRLVREIGSASGKPAALVIEGDETQADKAIVEMLFEPLLHVLRNAMDHGIEDAPTRLARGKPAAATILLRAERSGDQVVIELRDDGGGIDLDRVRKVALERQIVDSETLSGLGDEDVVNMIFEPGFSTAREVTGVSGRGVGMDAVRTAIRRAGGHVSIQTAAGRGTTVRFRLPFSVMMTSVMVVSAGGQAFGIPLDAIVETVRLDAQRIRPVGSAHAVVLRDRTVPVVCLAEALGLASDGPQASQATLVVTRSEGMHGALRVDRIEERMEVMLKPLEGLLAGTRGIAGSTLLGDGSVLLILDVMDLLQ